MGQKHGKPADSAGEASGSSERSEEVLDRFQVISDIKELVKEGNSHFQEGKFGLAESLYSRSLHRLFSEGVIYGILDMSRDDIEEMQSDELGEFEIERILMYADKLAEHCVSRIAAEKEKEKIAAFDEETSGLMDLVEGKKAEGDDLSYLLCFSTCVSDCCNNAASALFINKQTKASLQINYKVLKIRGLIHGANSIAAAESLQNISSCLDALQDLEAAEKRLKTAIEIESMHGLDGTVESTSMLNNLGVLYSHMGRTDQAEAILLNVLNHREEKLGKDHRLTKNAASNLEAVRSARSARSESKSSPEEAAVADGDDGEHLSSFPPSMMDDVESPRMAGSKPVVEEGVDGRLESFEG